MSEMAQVEDILQVHPMPEDAYESMPESFDPVVLANEPYIYERALCGAFYYGAESLVEAWKHYTAVVGKKPGEIILNAKHAAFIRHCMTLVKRGIPVTALTVVAEASESMRQEMGDVPYMLGHCSFCWSVQDATSSLQRLVDNWRQRSLNQITEDIAKGLEMGEEVNDLIARFSEASTKLLKTDCGGNTVDGETVIEALERIMDPKKDSPRTVPSRYRSLSAMAGEPMRGQIRAVGAPPGNGKTAYAIDEIGMALEHGFTVAAFLLESDVDQFVRRYITQRTGISANKSNPNHPAAGNYSPDELQEITKVGKQVWAFTKGLYLAKPSGYNAAGIRAALNEWKSETGGRSPDLIVIDHLDCLSAPDGHKGSAYDAQKENLLSLRALAGEEEAHMLICSQLTVEAVRSSFKGGKRVPTLGAFRGGSLGEFAKSVIVLHKDEDKMLSNDKVVEQQFVVVKTNDGSTGKVKSLFVKPCTLHLEDHSPEQRERYRELLQKYGYNPDKMREDSNQ